MFFYLILILISACAPTPAKQLPIPVKKQVVMVKKERAIMPTKAQYAINAEKDWQQFTVKYFNLEGGFYGLISEKGGRLLPMNLPTKYKVNGTILRVKGRPINNIVTIQQWGKPFEVSEIELVKMGEGKLPTH